MEGDKTMVQMEEWVKKRESTAQLGNALLNIVPVLAVNMNEYITLTNQLLAEKDAKIKELEQKLKDQSSQPKTK